MKAADSLVITFNVPNTDSVVNKVSATEQKAIRKLAGFLNGKERPYNKNCGFDGQMIFFRQGEILETVIFQYRVDSCRHFLFELNNKVMNTSMSNEAGNFLKSLGEGRGWY